jgi:hypothetical protein
MTNRHPIPTALSAASCIFLVLAVLAVVQVVDCFSRGSLNFQFYVLGFGIYFGLRRFSTGWRTCALVLIWIQLIVIPVIFVFGASARVPAFYAAGCLAWYLLQLWLYRVLTRPDIRNLFYDQPQPPTAC